MSKSKVIKADRQPPNIENFTLPSEEDYLQMLAAEDKQRRAEDGRSGAGSTAEASVDVEEIIAEARQQAESIKTEALNKGYAEGLEKAQQEENTALGDVLNNFRNTLEEIARVRERAIKENELEIVNLALDVARKLIGAELHNDPQTVAKVISKAISRLSVREGLVVKVNPEDHQILSNGTAEFLEAVKLVPDSTITRGGAVIESSGGNIDAQIEEQLAEIEKSLKQGIIHAEGAS